LVKQVIHSLQSERPDQADEAAGRHLLGAACRRSGLELPFPLVKELSGDILSGAFGLSAITNRPWMTEAALRCIA